MSKKVIIDLESLIDLYVNQGKTLSECEKSFNVSRPTIKKLLKENGIEINSKPQFKLFDNSYDTLYDLYVVQEKSLIEMKEILNGDLEKIRQKLHEYGIVLRNQTKAISIPISKEELYDLYWKDELTLNDIAKKFKLSSGLTIKKWFTQLGIELRSHSETQSNNMSKFIMTKNDYIKACNDIHDNRYDYSKMVYMRAGCQSVKIEIICKDHGQFFQLPKNHLHGNGCPSCGHIISKGENELSEFLSSLNINVIKSYREFEDNNYELDIYLPEYNMAVEFNGIYYHSEKFKDKNYHLDKTLLAQRHGIELFHIFENEWLYKKDICKSIILNKLNKITSKIPARKCKILEVSQSDQKNFLNLNHLQGYSIASKAYGLYYNDELVSLMSFGIPRMTDEYNYEMIRFCNKIFTTVVGGASRLLSHFKKNNKGTIISYSNKRISSGNLYKTLGFKYSHTSLPNYWYFKGKGHELFSRFKFQKHKLKDMLEKYDETLTEYDNMLNNNYQRIWDCGNDVWILE